MMSLRKSIGILSLSISFVVAQGNECNAMEWAKGLLGGGKKASSTSSVAQPAAAAEQGANQLADTLRLFQQTGELALSDMYAQICDIIEILEATERGPELKADFAAIKTALLQAIAGSIPGYMLGTSTIADVLRGCKGPLYMFIPLISKAMAIIKIELDNDPAMREVLAGFKTTVLGKIAEVEETLADSDDEEAEAEDKKESSTVKKGRVRKATEVEEDDEAELVAQKAKGKQPKTEIKKESKKEVTKKK